MEFYIIVVGFLFCLISIIGLLMWIIALQNTIDKKIQNGSFYRKQLSKQRDSRYARQRNTDDQLNRVKLSLFFLINGDETKAIDLLSGRTSDDGVKQDLFQIRKAINTEGKINKKNWWVTEETNTADSILYEEE